MAQSSIRNCTTAPPAPPLTINVNGDSLGPLIRAVVVEVLGQLEADRQQLDAVAGPQRLCWSEAEAAAMLGLEPHQLRDERLRGRIAASSIVGRRVRYTREDLVGYLAARRVDGTAEGGSDA